MRYIKKFNESVSQRLYKTITNQQRHQYEYDHNFEDFTDKELIIISKLFKDRRSGIIKVNGKTSFSINFTIHLDMRSQQQGGVYPDFANQNFPIEITKFSDDYWILYTKGCSFLCDTIDGIKDLMNDFKLTEYTIWSFHLLMSSKENLGR